MGNAFAFGLRPLFETTLLDFFFLWAGLTALFSIIEPGFHWTDPEFKKFRFRRSNRELLLSTNDEFAISLTSAILLAKTGETEALRALMVAPDHVNELLIAVAKVPPGKIIEPQHSRLHMGRYKYCRLPFLYETGCSR